MIDDGDAVGTAHRRQPVGDDDHRPARSSAARAPARRRPRCPDRGCSSPRRARAPPDRRARRGRARRAGARRPTAASRARAPRCRARRASSSKRSSTPIASSASRPRRRSRSARAMRMLSAIVPPNRKPSCGTTTIRSRSEASGAGADRRPPKVTCPSVGSYSRAMQLGERALAGAGRTDEREPLAVADGERHVASAPARSAPRSVNVDVVGDERTGRRQRRPASACSATSGTVSIRPYSLCSDAAADWTVLYSCDSCCTGSNRLPSSSTNGDDRADA